MSSKLGVALLAIGAGVVAFAVGAPPLVPYLSVAAVLVALLVSAEKFQAASTTPITGPSRDSIQPLPEAVASVVEAIDGPAILLDSQLDVRALNLAARSLFPQLRPGGPLSPAVRDPEVLEAVASTSASGVARAVEISHRSASERRLLVTLTPLRLEIPLASMSQGQPTDLLVQLRDQTEQDRLAQMRTDFIANASHELRTPLASLRGFIETLRGAAKDDSEAREKFLVIMDQQATRMSRIINDLLSLSRVEMRTHLMPDAIVDIVPIVSSVVNDLSPMAEETNAKISFNAPDDAFEVRGDRDELVQVFQNIIENALKYGRDSGTIEVRFERLLQSAHQPERVVVKISDDGPGIADEHLPRLTERFYRADTATSRERGGTGLGLAIVKNILARHRGELVIESEVGKGSTFSVVLNSTIPVQKPESLATASE